jgi:hypothetical protein
MAAGPSMKPIQLWRRHRAVLMLVAVVWLGSGFYIVDASSAVWCSSSAVTRKPPSRACVGAAVADPEP